jgi:NAD(P)-dependent dehydrogenase (short-subunit alcohol dehydrogenase family)
MEDGLNFQDKTVVVTGSGRNIGRAIVLEFAGRGAGVVVNARSNRDEAEAVAAEARELGAEALVVMGDAGELSVVNEMARVAVERFGRVDISVSNAARRLHTGFFELTHEDWHRHLNQQLTASWYLAKAFVPGMRDAGWGRLIHINGPDAWHGGHHRLPHSAGKGGLRTFTKGLAAELGPYNITVNDVIPGFTATARDPSTHPQVDAAFTQMSIEERIPIRRQVTPEEIAWSCAWLCSSRSGGVTGAAIPVTGGQWMIA